MANNQNYQATYLSYVMETTPGSTPATPAMKKLRTTNPLALNPGKELLESEEVFAHRQRENVRHGLMSVGGNVPVEFSYGALDDILAALVSGEWTMDVLKVGTTLKTMTIEQGYPTVGNYLHYRGVSPSQLTMNINPTGLITGTFDVVGMSFDSDAASLGSPTDVATDAPFDGLGSATIEEGGSAIAIVTSVEMVINANKTVGGIVGSAGADTPTDGQLQVTGTLTARFRDLALFDKFKNETTSSLKIVLASPTDPGDTLTITLPRLKFNGGDPQNNDNVVDISMDFEGLYDATDETSIIFER